MNIGETITEINASYEAAILKNIAGADASSVYDIDLAGPFFGIEWGVAEGNTQRQKWRWLSPRGQSHLFLKLSTETDHMIHVFIHSAVSRKIVAALTAQVNGIRCAQQGYEWGADGVTSHWCIVSRSLVAKSRGIAKITWSVLTAGERPRILGANSEQGHPAHARSIAFSRVKCEPYSGIAVRRRYVGVKFLLQNRLIRLQRRLKSKLQQALHSK